MLRLKPRLFIPWQGVSVHLVKDPAHKLTSLILCFCFPISLLAITEQLQAFFPCLCSLLYMSRGTKIPAQAELPPPN